MTVTRRQLQMIKNQDQKHDGDDVVDEEMGRRRNQRREKIKKEIHTQVRRLAQPSRVHLLYILIFLFAFFFIQYLRAQHQTNYIRNDGAESSSTRKRRRSR